MSKPDITTREDIVLLIDTFYKKVKVNKTLGYIFNDVARVDWEHHLPVMYSFWSSLLLGDRTYTGNPMQKHIDLNKITPLTSTGFSEWLLLFKQTTDELFEGDKAEEAKSRAEIIAGSILHKIAMVK
jgi:hemoglobin